MSNYFFIFALINILIFTIIREIYLYSKGRYNPYLSFIKDKYLQNFIIFFSLYISTIFCVKNIKPISVSLYIFLAYSFCFAVCICILNYLSYKKNKDKKIILYTVLFIIMLIVISIYLWKLIMK